MGFSEQGSTVTYNGVSGIPVQSLNGTLFFEHESQIYVFSGLVENILEQHPGAIYV